MWCSSQQGRARTLFESLRKQLSAPEFDNAYAAGEAMSLDQVLADLDDAR